MAERGGPVKGLPLATPSLMRQATRRLSEGNGPVALADEECAHALLDLAMSFVPSRPQLHAGREDNEDRFPVLPQDCKVDSSPYWPITTETDSNQMSPEYVQPTQTVRKYTDKDTVDVPTNETVESSHVNKWSTDMEEMSQSIELTDHQDEAKMYSNTKQTYERDNSCDLKANCRNNYPCGSIGVEPRVMDCALQRDSESSISPESWSAPTSWMTPVSPQVSLLRMQLDAPPHVQMSSSKALSKEEELLFELIKRIQLDHNYARTGYSEFSNLTVIQGYDPFIPNQSPYFQPSPVDQQMTPHVVQVTEQNIMGTKLFKDKANPGSDPTGDSASSDVKHQNFHLLLKCLTVANDSERRSVIGPDDEKRSVIGLAAVHDLERSSVRNKDEDCGLDSLAVGETSVNNQGYTCTLCSKSFSKKRYLTKHLWRMHPGSASPYLTADEPVTCPNCQKVTTRRKLKKHTAMCKSLAKKDKKVTDADMATCQFCGVSLKRHLLVKHLANEHCVEGSLEQGQMIYCGREGDPISPHPSTSGSKTVYFSLYHNCNVCKEILELSCVISHFCDHHNLDPSAPGICSLCQEKLAVQDNSLFSHVVTSHCKSVEPTPRKPATQLAIEQTQFSHDPELSQDDTSPDGPRTVCTSKKEEAEVEHTEPSMDITVSVADPELSHSQSYKNEHTPDKSETQEVNRWSAVAYSNQTGAGRSFLVEDSFIHTFDKNDTIYTVEST